MQNLDYPGVAVMGSGYWGRNLVRNFHALGALRMVCDSNEEILPALRSQYAGVKITPSFVEVLADPTVQGLVIATRASLHASMVRQALLADKDVLVEKPLALTEKDGEGLVQLAEQRGRVLMVGHLLWYHPAVRKLKDLVDSGELGRLQYIYYRGSVRRINMPHERSFTLDQNLTASPEYPDGRSASHSMRPRHWHRLSSFTLAST